MHRTLPRLDLANHLPILHSSIQVSYRFGIRMYGVYRSSSIQILRGIDITSIEARAQFIHILVSLKTRYVYMLILRDMRMISLKCRYVYILILRDMPNELLYPIKTRYVYILILRDMRIVSLKTRCVSMQHLRETHMHRSSIHRITFSSQVNDIFRISNNSWDHVTSLNV